MGCYRTILAAVDSRDSAAGGAGAVRARSVRIELLLDVLDEECDAHVSAPFIEVVAT
jgi:hypothetical protein